MLENNKELKDGAPFEAAFERLEKASHKMAEALYKTASANAGTDTAPSEGAAGEQPQGGKDDVIDAEFTEGPKNA